MIRCCIFDLDGTLLNTLDALTYTTNLTLKEFGYGPVDPEHIKQFVGDGYRMQMKRALVLAGDEKLVHYEASLPIYMRLSSPLLRWFPLPGSQPPLCLLRLSLLRCCCCHMRSWKVPLLPGRALKQI